MDPTNAERYDRQIRLWGQHGQSKCAMARVCLIGCSSLGMEIARGLCLAGIGSFTILDSHKMLPEDVGCCFIAQDKTIGRSRANVTKTMLLDLNEDCSVEIQPLETYLPHVTATVAISPTDDQTQDDIDGFANDSEIWKYFNCVVVSGVLYKKQIQRLSRICWSLNVPLIICKSLGFFATARSQLKEHVIVDTHPEWRPKNHDSSKPDTATIAGTKAIFEEYDNNVYQQQDGEEQDDHITVYICMAALDLFYTNYGRLPGSSNDQIETDLNKLKECVKIMIGKSYIHLKTLDQCLYEICRYGGSELHTTSAFLGGCIAQEIIKIVTNQYLPIDDTLVYNAMTATTRCLKLENLLTTKC